VGEKTLKVGENWIVVNLGGGKKKSQKGKAGPRAQLEIGRGR